MRLTHSQAELKRMMVKVTIGQMQIHVGVVHRNPKEAATCSILAVPVGSS